MMLHNPIYPSDDFKNTTLDLECPKVTHWYRIYHNSRNAIEWNQEPRNRFNAPHGEYGVLYPASSFNGAFVETLGRTPKQHIVSELSIKERRVAKLESRDLSLINLNGPTLAKLGLDANLMSYPDYDWTRAWSLALWNHPVKADGLLYISRFDPSQQCMVVFDRATNKLSALNSVSLYKHSALPKCLELYEFSII